MLTNWELDMFPTNLLLDARCQRRFACAFGLAGVFTFAFPLALPRPLAAFGGGASGAAPRDETDSVSVVTFSNPVCGVNAFTTFTISCFAGLSRKSKPNLNNVETTLL